MYPEIYDLLDFTSKAVSPWHTVEASIKRLRARGFKELTLGESWKLETGQGYYVNIFESSLVAFVAGEGDMTAPGGIRVAAAHTDFPGLRIKPEPEILREGYGLLNIEAYGGMILASWRDRPLSIAGRVILRGEECFAPKSQLVDFQRPLMTIPSLAIHLDRKANEELTLKKQKDMLPLMSILGKAGEEKFFTECLAQEVGCLPEDILAYELNLYPYEGGSQFGLAKELVSSGRLDNLTSALACLKGIQAAQGNISNGLSLIALFDNEEIGSRTKQGAGSVILLQVVERIASALGLEKEVLWQAMSQGIMLSVDVAHGLHPNYGEKYDPVVRPKLNGGVVLKQASSQSYACDGRAMAIVKELCRAGNIPYQNFVNHADMPGGATLGSIASALLPMAAMDVGVPILSMHSARETMGAADQGALEKLLISFFTQG